MRFIFLLAAVAVLLSSTGCIFWDGRGGGGGRGFSDHGGYDGDHGRDHDEHSGGMDHHDHP